MSTPLTRWQRNPHARDCYATLWTKYPNIFGYRKPWRRPLLEGGWQYATDEEVAKSYLKEEFDREQGDTLQS